MRGIKAALLLAGFAMLAWALLNLAQEAMAVWPLWKIWHLGAAGACIYVAFDLADRWREWLGYRGGARRPRRQWYPGRRYE